MRLTLLLAFILCGVSSCTREPSGVARQTDPVQEGVSVDIGDERVFPCFDQALAANAVRSTTDHNREGTVVGPRALLSGRQRTARQSAVRSGAMHVS